MIDEEEDPFNVKKENDDEFDYFVEGGTTNFLEIDKHSSQVSA